MCGGLAGETFGRGCSGTFGTPSRMGDLDHGTAGKRKDYGGAASRQSPCCGLDDRRSPGPCPGPTSHRGSRMGDRRAGRARPPDPGPHRQDPDRSRLGRHSRCDGAAARVASGCTRMDRTLCRGAARMSIRGLRGARARDALAAGRHSIWRWRGNDDKSRDRSRLRGVIASGSSPPHRYPQSHNDGGRGRAAGPATRGGPHGSVHRYGEDHPMKVRDLMSADPIAVSPDTTVFDARQTMLKERIRPFFVTEGHRPLGIVTDRDIRLNLPSQATSLSVWEVNYLLARLTVEEVMTTGVIIIGPDQNARNAARLMLEHKIGALPVLDAGRLIGIITETDVLRAFARTPEPAEQT